MLPVITLFTHTADPLKAIVLGMEVWENPEFMDRAKDWSMEYMVNRFQELLKMPHQTPLEYFSTVWVLENVSRAFQQQLTRHRIGFSYNIQSLRMVEQRNFATEGRYHCPESVKDRKIYHSRMAIIENLYNNSLNDGESSEDSRGLLPLNIYSPITMSCSYRALVGLLRQRLCVMAQEEWKEVAEQMRSALIKIHPVFAEPLTCFCGRQNPHIGHPSVCRTSGKLVNREGIL